MSKYTVLELADHLESCLHAMEDGFWFDGGDKEHPVVSPHVRGLIQEKIAMIRAGDYSTAFTKIGILNRGRTGEAHFIQEVFSIPLPLHGTLDVYMAERHDGDKHADE